MIQTHLTVALGLMLVACTRLPPAPPPAATRPVAPAEPAMPDAQALAADQITLETGGLWSDWQAYVVPATPYDNSQPPGPTGMPEHMLIAFDGMSPSAVTPSTPALYIIPVTAYEDLWRAAGNESVPRTMQNIYSTTVALQQPPPVAGLPALPFEQVGGGVNDLAVQQGRVPAPPESASKSGYRFVGRWVQDATPVTNQNLRYVYQGFTNDGRYLVSFFVPISTTELPASADQVSADDMQQVQSDPSAYLARQAEALNALPSSAWQPAIDQLDAVVASLRITGMQAYGLQGPPWRLIAQRNQGVEEPLDAPERYTVAFGPNGALAVQADCNRLTGTYTAEGGSIGGMRTQLGPSTLADCGPESHADLLINVLVSAQNYKVRPGGTVLELIQPAGGTVLIFER